MIGTVVPLLICIGMLFRLVLRYEKALIRISHYQGDSLDYIRAIADKAVGKGGRR